MSRKQIKEFKPWHNQLIDWLIENPRRPQRECAEHFGVTTIWISMVVNSDIFKEALALRRDRHADLVSRTVIHRTRAVAEQSLEELSSRLDEPENIPTGEVREIAAMALKTLGFGGPSAGPNMQVNGGTVNVLSVDSTALERARNLMRAVQEEPVEAEHTSLPSPEQVEARG